MPAQSEYEVINVKTDFDLVKARQQIREYATKISLNLVSQTKLVTASSELARNMIEYAGGGQMSVRKLLAKGRAGVQVKFEDQGPGIEDLDLAMQDGYTTGKGMGLGLPGAKRLVHEFSIFSKPGKGTRVTIVMWKL